MTANDTTTHDAERSIDTLRSTFKSAAAAVDELADALEAGDADEAAVAETYRQVATAAVSIEDAAESAEVIDPYTDEWRAVDEARKAMYHATARLTADEATIAPTAERSRREALRAATTAAEHLDMTDDIDGDGSTDETYGVVGNLEGEPRPWVPPEVADALGVGVGDTVTYRIEDGRVVMTPGSD